VIQAIESWGEPESVGICTWIRSHKLLIQSAHGIRRSDGAQNEGILIHPRKQFVRRTSGIPDLGHQAIADLPLNAHVVLEDVGRLEMNVDEVIPRAEKWREPSVGEINVRRRRFLGRKGIY
jgi:hypothetical protein